MNKNLNFIWILWLSQIIITSIVEKKASDIAVEEQGNSQINGNFFSKLQRRLKLESMNEPVALTNLDLGSIGQHELTFPHQLDIMKNNIEDLRNNEQAYIPNEIKDAAVSVYIANAEFIAEKKFNHNASKKERRTQQIDSNENSPESNIKLTQAVNSKPERMLKQIRKTTDISPLLDVNNKHENDFDYLKKAEEGKLFEIDLNSMYDITKEDLDIFGQRAGNATKR